MLRTPGCISLAFIAALSIGFPTVSIAWDANLTASNDVNSGSVTLSWQPSGPGLYRLFTQREGSSSAIHLGWANHSTSSITVTNQPEGRHKFWVTHRYAVCEPSGGRGRPDCTYITDISEPAWSRTATGPIPTKDDPATQITYSYRVRSGDINSDGLMDLHVQRTSGNLDNGVVAEQIILRQSTGRFSLLNADSADLVTARNWPILSSVEVRPVDMNMDGTVDLVLRGISGANSQILASSGEFYQRQAVRIGEFDDDTTKFVEDVYSFIGDRDYFDDAIQDEEAYNVKIEMTIGACYFLFGYPVCSDFTETLAEFEIPLDDLGLDGFISSQTLQSPSGIPLSTAANAISSTVHAAAQPTLSQQGISNLAAHTPLAAEAQTRITQKIAFVSVGGPDVLRCVIWCGGLIRTFLDGSGYTYAYWVDTWTPITIPGVFDSENFSEEAYELSQELDFLSQNNWVRAATYPPAQRALERGVIWVGGVTGIGVILEDIWDRIEELGEEEEPIMDPSAQVVLEGIVAAACGNYNDPAECQEAVEDALGEELDRPLPGLPPVFGPVAEVDTDEFDIDYILGAFPAATVALTGLKASTRMNCTYLKFNPTLNRTYYGRTSGPQGTTCLQNIARRDAAHNRSLLLKGFGPAAPDRGATGILGYAAIRGREQQLIDSWMVDGRTRLNVANIIRGVAKSNPLGCQYHLASDTAFLPLSPYTGNGSCP